MFFLDWMNRAHVAVHFPVTHIGLYILGANPHSWHNPNSSHILTILMSLTASVISGAIFVFALFRQFALVEVAASLLTGLQVFFLSSAVADMLEKKKEPNRFRISAVVLVTIFLIAFYSFNLYRY